MMFKIEGWWNCDIYNLSDRYILAELRPKAAMRSPIPYRTHAFTFVWSSPSAVNGSRARTNDGVAQDGARPHVGHCLTLFDNWLWENGKEYLYFVKWARSRHLKHH